MDHSARTVGNQLPDALVQWADHRQRCLIAEVNLLREMLGLGPVILPVRRPSGAITSAPIDKEDA